MNGSAETQGSNTGRTDKDVRKHTDYINTTADYKQDIGGHRKRVRNSHKGRN